MKKFCLMMSALALGLALLLSSCGGESNSLPSNSPAPGTPAPTVPAETASAPPQEEPSTEPKGDGEKILIAYFSATNNTEGIANHLKSILDADLYEIVPETPYTSDDLNYNDSSSRSSQEMNDPDARPAISGSVENMERYDVIFLGYPNWWASIPMPIASLLEEYDFTGKTIVPFCSHGGGRFGQSLTAITKLVPDAFLGEGLAISYSGGSSLSEDVTAWLSENGVPAS